MNYMHRHAKKRRPKQIRQPFASLEPPGSRNPKACKSLVPEHDYDLATRKEENGKTMTSSQCAQPFLPVCRFRGGSLALCSTDLASEARAPDMRTDPALLSETAPLQSYKFFWRPGLSANSRDCTPFLRKLLRKMSDYWTCSEAPAVCEAKQRIMQTECIWRTLPALRP